MLSLIKITKELEEELSKLSCDVYHYYAKPSQSTDYIVFAETGEGNSFYADNGKHEQVLEGYVEFYTQTEYNSLCDSIQQVLENVTDAWELALVEYSDEEKLIRFIWNWQIRGKDNG